ncbi:MAG: cyclic nucleotide-binding domain-containing protein [Candidatus Tectomicrobia bacterium]|nr:cyclic nucleotide-binding domain-containing protein [Candidatus Tectomicrobia bacterium]
MSALGQGSGSPPGAGHTAPPHPPDLTDAQRHLIQKLREDYHFFSEMTEGEIAAFLRLCKQAAYEKGQSIFQQGESARDFYLVISGEVVITVQGREVARLGPGKVFGEMSLLEKIPRTATATAAEPARVFTIPAAVMSAKAPLLAYKVLLSVAQQMSEKLRQTNATLLPS